ncbi:hypothetical protein Aargi30884_17530 [Amedibacterium intestinale]|uniref:Resolvase/invertase-type recombinase catalytic domain-containing protein n=1 Tax=Amedibacterium intestinale TaxID=2583452 RepID=A0A6N4TIK8_9FIRM|nr:recombinase family protein [Amedibacterium intestinale]BBK22850.1 hypothetical protein Aargi30884_17530 [Amedibacterium intestinale]
MKNSLKVWIHCRVSNEHERYLLNYQKKKLLHLVNHSNLRVIGISSEVSKGTNPHSREISTMKTYAKRKEIDAILVYDPTRILVYDDMFAEFKMYCEMNDVVVISLQEIETSFQSFMLSK